MTQRRRTRARIVVLSPDPSVTDPVRAQLVRRYAGDHDVVAGEDRVGVSACRGAAIVLGDVMWDGMPSLFAELRASSPSTRRLGIAPVGMPVASDRLQGLLREGLLQWFVVRPQVDPDEQFHRVISEILEEWSREHSVIFEVVRMVDDETSTGHRLRDLLSRNNVAHGCYRSSSAEGRRLLEQHAASASDLPLVVLHDGRSMTSPTERDLADAISGQTGRSITEADLVVVGAGPAGLAAAVYAASEGLSVAVLEREAIGGQAGTTSSIRNYLGFQRGITGQELASRAFRQAWGFGAQVRFIREACGVHPMTDGFVVDVVDDPPITARSVVLAQGAIYRRLGIPRLEELIGAGVFYGAAVTEAPETRGKHVHVVGGGNSAGQAAVHLAKFAAHVTLLVRDDSLANSMSSYVIEEMASAPNIAIQYGCQVVDGGGERRLEWIEIEDRPSGTRRRVDASALFVLIGAIPATEWLPRTIGTDEWGFVLTGREAETSPLWRHARRALPFETTMPGVFAVGDLRHGSVKRVASAVGEGSVVIQSVHVYLQAGYQSSTVAAKAS